MRNKSTTELEKTLQSIPKERLIHLLSDLKEINLPSYFNELITKYDLRISNIISATTIQRNYFYQIINGEKEKPGRDKIIQIGLAISCSLDELNHLLQFSRNEKLYAKNKRDCLLIYGLTNKLSVLETNELLQSNDYNLL